MKSGERASEAADLIGNNPIAKTAVDFRILVRIDEYLIDLRRKTFEHPCHHGFAAQFAQSLVDAAHALTASAGKNHAGDASAHLVNR